MTTKEGADSMLNEKADELLKEEVAQKEILNFFESKYGVKYLVTQKTIQRWLKSSGIECIQPRPNRNSDIRYRKSDILKLEKLKRVNLLKKRNAELEKMSRKEVGGIIKQTLEDSERSYNDSLSSMTPGDLRQQDIDDSHNYSGEALKQIREDKLEMCFNKLFPNVVFDQKKLEEILFIRNEPFMHTDEECGQAEEEFESKAYIKNYK